MSNSSILIIQQTCQPFQSICVNSWTRVNQRAQLLPHRINFNRGEKIVPDKFNQEKINNKVALLKRLRGQNNMEMIASKNKKQDKKSWSISWDSNNCSSNNSNSRLSKLSRNKCSRNKLNKPTRSSYSSNSNRKMHSKGNNNK